MKIAEVVETLQVGTHPNLRVVRMRRSFKEWWADFQKDCRPPLYSIEVGIVEEIRWSLNASDWFEREKWVVISRSRSRLNAQASARLLAARARRNGVCNYACSRAHGDLGWRDEA